MSEPLPPDLPADDELTELELPKGTRSIPFDRTTASGPPEEHVSFDEFWAALDLPATEENDRLRELFYEWLGQNGFDVHRRDEPTIVGNLRGWRATWAHYLKVRKLK